MLQQHRVWHFIKMAKESGQDAIVFHYPTSKCADRTYEALKQLLRMEGLIVTDLIPRGPWSGQAMAISNIKGVKV